MDRRADITEVVGNEVSFETVRTSTLLTLDPPGLALLVVIECPKSDKLWPEVLLVSFEPFGLWFVWVGDLPLLLSLLFWANCEASRSWKWEFLGTGLLGLDFSSKAVKLLKAWLPLPLLLSELFGGRAMICGCGLTKSGEADASKIELIPFWGAVEVCCPKEDLFRYDR